MTRKTDEFEDVTASEALDLYIDERRRDSLGGLRSSDNPQIYTNQRL